MSETARVLELHPPGLAERVPSDLRRLRHARNMTLQAVADKIGTTAQTVQRLETANMVMTLEWLDKLCWAYRIDPAVLFEARSGLRLAVSQFELEAEREALANHLETIADKIRGKA
jgi:transcriptional regulator with XRE-family HTH domain